MPTAKITISCKCCLKAFSVYRSRLKYGRGTYCSKTCQTKTISGTRRAPTINLKCLCCGVEFQTLKSTLNPKFQRGKYCSSKCRYDYRKVSGKYKKRGPNWKTQRLLALIRDKEICQHCGQFGNSVHHIIPFRLFGISAYIEANDLTNLITLCQSCHLKEDHKIRKMEKCNE